MRRVLLVTACLLAACTSDRDPTITARTVPTVSTTSSSTSSSTALPRPTSTRRPSVGLQGALDRAVAGSRVPVSAVAINLVTGERAAHLSSRVVLSASLYKLFVAHELFRRIAAGTVSRDEPSGDGSHTVHECLRLMIVISDDGCGVAGLNKIGKGDMDASLHRDGYVGTYLASPQRTTAADVALFFERERAANSELYGLLGQQQVRTRIPPALPDGTRVHHKTGDRTGWMHDAGVITTPGGDLLVAILTGPWPSPCCHEERIGALEREAFALIGGIARKLYDYTAP